MDSVITRQIRSVVCKDRAGCLMFFLLVTASCQPCWTEMYLGLAALMDINVPRAGSPRDINIPRAASPGDKNVPRAASPVGHKCT